MLIRHVAQLLTATMAVLLATACRLDTGQNAGGSKPSLANEMSSTRPDSSLRGEVDCLTAERLELRRMCGTMSVKLEYAPEVGMNRRKHLAFGERADEASAHLRAVNRHLANTRAARPELFADVLRTAAADIRNRSVRMCELEGRSVPSQMSLRSDFLRALLWVQYRHSLINGNADEFVRQVDSLLADPCFAEDRALYFERLPAAFASPGDSAYALTGSFAAALAHYHRRKGESLVSDAYAFRAAIDEADDAKIACLDRAFEVQRSNLSGTKGRLWDRCLQLRAAGGSCMVRQKQCSR